MFPRGICSFLFEFPNCRAYLISKSVCTVLSDPRKMRKYACFPSSLLVFSPIPIPLASVFQKLLKGTPTPLAGCQGETSLFCILVVTQTYTKQTLLMYLIS
ncbi:unnamed protein product [Rangifer tarandus platyrhynchus]|uniref:Uncharacterized protein n=2 Tax=Rangifer tarandus platyrhynchus TaxID=3082113 RepID=A0AC59ZW32_RANTA|nr:unnamed protein product [Rangifer tarandus platyrhynchus]